MTKACIFWDGHGMYVAHPPYSNFPTFIQNWPLGPGTDMECTLLILHILIFQYLFKIGPWAPGPHGPHVFHIFDFDCHSDRSLHRILKCHTAAQGAANLRMFVHQLSWPILLVWQLTADVCSHSSSKGFSSHESIQFFWTNGISR